MEKRIDLLLEIESLKTEFLVKNLDLSEIWNQPNDLLRTRRELKYMLFCLDKCQQANTTMDLMIECPFAPPVNDPTTVDEDWAMFRAWASGKPVRQMMKDLVELEDPDQIDLNTVSDKLEKLIEQIQEAGTFVEFPNGIDQAPDIILYKMFYEWITIENPIAYTGGGWVMDGCGYYCPGCLLRPWCDLAGNFCWSEDDEIKSMYLRPELHEHVSAWPAIYPEMRRMHDLHNKT